MTQPRQSTPGNTNPRVRSADERPGDVSDPIMHVFESITNEFSAARLVVQITIRLTSCSVTVATMDTMDIVSTRQFVAYLRMTGTVLGALLVQVNLALKKAVFTP